VQTMRGLKEGIRCNGAWIKVCKKAGKNKETPAVRYGRSF